MEAVLYDRPREGRKDFGASVWLEPFRCEIGRIKDK